MEILTPWEDDNVQNDRDDPAHDPATEDELAYYRDMRIGRQLIEDERPHVRMVDPQGQLLSEVADERTTRDDVVLTYAFCLRQGDVDWVMINRAVIERWSLSGLKYIKERAWRRCRGS